MGLETLLAFGALGGSAGAVSGGTALAAGGAALGGLGGLVGGFVEASAYDRAARGEIDAARQREIITRRDGERGLGRTRAALAGSGLTMEGSALDLIADEAGTAELSALLTRYEGQSRAAALRDRARGARIGGLAAFGSGILDAGSTILGGQTRLQTMFPRNPPRMPGAGAGGGLGGGLRFGGLIGGGGIGQGALS